jgi:glycerophosphoryl diester phosphodiesterase
MPPFIIAHRGDSAHRPENTLASFASALQLGADLVEFDVQLTSDGHVVVIHDPTLDRTTSGNGRVGERSLAEIRGLSAGYPKLFGADYASERVPTLVEALAFLRDRGRVMIEIKPDSVSDNGDDGIEARTITDVRRAGMEKDVALLSFSGRALKRCRDFAPEIVRAHLFHQAEIEAVLAGARETGCDLVLPEKGMLSTTLRDRVRQAGLRMATWVVDDPDELAALAPLDLYGIATNRPGVLLEAIMENE